MRYLAPILSRMADVEAGEGLPAVIPLPRFVRAVPSTSTAYGTPTTF
jgi:hypothetical protein